MPDVFINKKGICNYCSNKKAYGRLKKEVFLNLKKQQNNLFNEFLRIERDGYDCIVALSGGKDSAYMLYILKEIYDKNPLAITIDTGLLNKSAIKNIDILVKNLNVNHFYFKSKNDFFKRLYCDFLVNSNEQSHVYSVCRECHKSIINHCIKIAYEKQIPYICIGSTLDQKIPFHATTDKRIRKILLNDDLYTIDYDFSKKSFNQLYERYKIKHFNPKIILPFYSINYPKVNNIIKLLSKRLSVNKKRFNQLNTNCHMVWLLNYLDLIENNYTPYEANLSQAIRLGYEKKRDWLLKVRLGGWLLKHRLIKRKSIKKSLNFLNMKIDEIDNYFKFF